MVLDEAGASTELRHFQDVYPSDPRSFFPTQHQTVIAPTPLPTPLWGFRISHSYFCIAILKIQLSISNSDFFLLNVMSGFGFFPSRV